MLICFSGLGGFFIGNQQASISLYSGYYTGVVEAIDQSDVAIRVYPTNEAPNESGLARLSISFYRQNASRTNNKLPVVGKS